MDYLEKEYRKKEEGREEYSNLQVHTSFRASDMKIFETFDEALEYDKTINVLARHRNAKPDRISTYTATDGTVFIDVFNEVTTWIYDARTYQQKLDAQLQLEYVADKLYCSGIGDVYELERELAENMNLLRKWLGASMMFGDPCPINRDEWKL